MLGIAAGIALAVSPAHASLAAPASRAFEVRNAGTQPVVVDVKPSARWLLIRPRQLRIAPGAHTEVTARARAAASTRAGDHELVVLLLARSQQPSRVPVRIRLGVRLRVRVPGRLVHRLVPRGVRVRGRPRTLLVSVANAGNVTEQLRGRVAVTLLRGGRALSRLRYGAARELFPGAATVLQLPYRGGVRGRVIAVVRTGAVTRRYRLRL